MRSAATGAVAGSIVVVSLVMLLPSVRADSSAETTELPGQNTGRPNIVLMMADDQGWEETGYNRHPAVKTPTLDRMAAAGLRFDRFYAGAPNCGPTRGSIMTGRSSNRFGLLSPNDAIRPEEQTLARLLQQAGYATGHFGKWHLGPVKGAAPNNPGRMGFDEWLSHDNYFDNDPPLSRNGARPETVQGESSMVVANSALDFIRRSQGTGKPFFVLVWFGSPHDPYVSLPEDEAIYAQVESPLLRRRFAEITAMDRAIGHFRGQLREMGLTSNTMLWYESDNGVPSDGLYKPTLKGAKQGVYENGLRVPAILEWPARIPKPRATPVPMVTHDLLPTILDLVGLPIPTDRPLDGISMRALIEGRMTERPKPVGGFWTYPRQGEVKNEPWMATDVLQGETPNFTNPNGVTFFNFRHPTAKTADFGGNAAWMTNQYKLVARAGNAPELYDLLKDPGESTDLAAAQPGLVQALLADLRAWQASVETSLTGADYRR